MINLKTFLKENNACNFKKKHVVLAQRIAHKIWGKYSDEFGYKSDKRLKNKMVDPNNIENIYFFIAQFGVHDQQRFYARAKLYRETGLELARWIQDNYFDRLKEL